MTWFALLGIHVLHRYVLMNSFFLLFTMLHVCAYEQFFSFVVFSWECDILSHLLQAQILMAEWQFLPSLLQLHAAHSKLQTWLTAAAVKEVSAVLGVQLCPKNGCRTVLQEWVQDSAPRMGAEQCPEIGCRTVPRDWVQNSPETG